jgi:hypothetical protein
MEHNDGGPAFPTNTEDGYCIGLSLRDYFSAKAMQSLLVAGGWGDYERLVKMAYQIADAMLKAREAE